MADVFPKWIVEDDTIVIQKCIFHYQIAENQENVKGGGLFEYNGDDESFLLYGKSDKFNRASLEQLQQCVAKGFVGNYIEDDNYIRCKLMFSTELYLEDALNNYIILKEHG